VEVKEEIKHKEMELLSMLPHLVLQSEFLCVPIFDVQWLFKNVYRFG